MSEHAPAAPSYYRPIAAPDGADPGYEYFVPTAATVSVWSSDIQHGGPPAGLMMRALIRAAGDDGKAFTRVTTEILGAMGLGVNRVRASVVRPGKRISQVAADLEVQAPSGEFRVVARTVAWRIMTGDSSPVEHSPVPPLPAGPDELPQIVGFPDDGEMAVPWGKIGFIGTTVIARQAGRNGQTPAVWIRPAIGLIEDEEMSPLESMFTVLDVANGVGTQLDPTQWSWMNMDTTVHLVAQPTSPWLGLDADLAIGAAGYGASFADLYDVSGFIGRSAQTDMIAPAG
ncbi:thioesterase family protein [Gordonia liuliyuniae]|uniref:Thioesterase family protein n=1 Tax=Gordonia liuliyuniae TaxID=2911517 RepID=A0ABS9IQS5_9ACTN|nr:thioesterase family protein [Gordonia liuliyuniae]MCF8587911.1 thioesterase family protein [Gordonia liuliyuniae]